MRLIAPGDPGALPQASAQSRAAVCIALAITSGRPPRGMSMLIKPLALRGAIAGFNGGVFVNPDLSVIESVINSRRRIPPPC
jgi:hydroxymethylpyrimidine pyrophosphatase-like HAD family hydrolase